MRLAVGASRGPSVADVHCARGGQDTSAAALALWVTRLVTLIADWAEVGQG